MLAELTRITTAAAVARDPEEARIACELHARTTAEAAFPFMMRPSTSS